MREILGSALDDACSYWTSVSLLTFKRFDYFEKKKKKPAVEFFLPVLCWQDWYQQSAGLKRAKNCLHIKHDVFQWVIIYLQAQSKKKKRNGKFFSVEMSWPEYRDFLNGAQARPEETRTPAWCHRWKFTEFSCHDCDDSLLMQLQITKFINVMIYLWVQNPSRRGLLASFTAVCRHGREILWLHFMFLLSVSQQSLMLLLLF